MSLIRDTNEYITRAIKKHGNKYDYSKTIYTGCYKKIVVTCPIHGDFEIKAASHLIGRGCRKCGVASRAEKRTLSYEAFIERATQKFGHTYSYNRFTYRGASQKMLIICPKHGEYWHTPLQHINQNGCPKCSGSGHKNTQDFIVDAQAIHGDRYDYSKVDYVTSKKKVCIVCKQHGDFWQNPTSHLRGIGCPKCGKEDMARHQSSDTPTFIKKAKNLHGGRYDYINTVYVSRGKKVEIICPKHGSFFQTPKEHLRGQGCPYCTESSGERKIAEWLKSHSIEFISQYHIKPQQKCLFGRNYFRVDFYIPHKKIIIEYNGKQHYELVPHFHTIAEFQDQQDRDKRLRIYCKQNKITLIEIPYTADKRINNILNKHIL